MMRGCIGHLEYAGAA